jgi:hypothetical protein
LGAVLEGARMLELPDWEHWGRIKTLSLRDALVLSINLCPINYNHENSDEIEFEYAKKYWQNLQIAKNHVYDAEWLVGKVAREDSDIDLCLTNVDLCKFSYWALNVVHISELPTEMEILGGLEFSSDNIPNENDCREDLVTNIALSPNDLKPVMNTSALQPQDVQHSPEQNSILSPTPKSKTAAMQHQQIISKVDTSHTTKVSIHKHRDILDPVIERAKKMAGNSSDWQAVWPYMCQLAQDEHPPLLGHFPQGIKYSDGLDSKFLTKDAFRKRMKRSQK